jgi:hypothetical protein
LLLDTPGCACSSLIDPHTMPVTHIDTVDQIASHCVKRPALRATAKEFMPAETCHLQNANSLVREWLSDQNYRQQPGWKKPYTARKTHRGRHWTGPGFKGRWKCPNPPPLQPPPITSGEYFPNQDGPVCASYPILKPTDPFHEQIERITSQVATMRTCEKIAYKHDHTWDDPDPRPSGSRSFSGTGKR